MPHPLKENEDYYISKEGLYVFTEHYLLKRGYCCKSGCRHCPYGYKKQGSAKADGADGRNAADQEGGQQ